MIENNETRRLRLILSMDGRHIHGRVNHSLIVVILDIQTVLLQSPLELLLLKV
jgi:hypothetical protein